MIEVQVATGDDDRHLVGQLIPPAPADVTVAVARRSSAGRRRRPRPLQRRQRSGRAGPAGAATATGTRPSSRGGSCSELSSDTLPACQHGRAARTCRARARAGRRRPGRGAMAAAELLAAARDPEATSVALRSRRPGSMPGKVSRARRAGAPAPRDQRRRARPTSPVRAAQARASLVVVLVSLGAVRRRARRGRARPTPALTGPDRGLVLAQRAVALSRLDRTDEALAAYTEALRAAPGRPCACTAMVLHEPRAAARPTAASSTRLDAISSSCRRARAEQHQLRAGRGRRDPQPRLPRPAQGDLVSALAELDRSESHASRASRSTLPRSCSTGPRRCSPRTSPTRRGATARDRGGASPPRADGGPTSPRPSSRWPGHCSSPATRPSARCARRHGPGRCSASRDARAGPRSPTSSRCAAGGRRGERGPQLIKDALGVRRRVWRTPAGAPPALRARVLAAEALLAARSPAEAAAELRSAGAARRAAATPTSGSPRGTPRRSCGSPADDRAGALRALTAGLDVVDAHSAALGATDLRTQSMSRGRPLADLGLNLVIGPRTGPATSSGGSSGPGRPRCADARPARRATPGSPPTLPTCVGSRRRSPQHAAPGRTRPTCAASSCGSSGRSGTTRGTPAAAASRTSRLDVARLGAALGDRALVEYFSAGRPAARAGPGRRPLPDHRAVGATHEALREAESLRFAMHRLARRHGSGLARGRARDPRLRRRRARRGAARPAAPSMIGDRELVVVPTMRLHALPWPALPSLDRSPGERRPVGRAWLAAAQAPRRGAAATSCVVAGPDLVFAEPELRAVGRLYPGAARLPGRRRRPSACSSAIDGARVAHIACHGHFRTDNPQFSSLRLADGPLMVYDLERLRRAPDLIVLSSCDAALSAVHPGDELVGPVQRAVRARHADPGGRGQPGRRRGREDAHGRLPRAGSPGPLPRRRPGRGAASSTA